MSDDGTGDTHLTTAGRTIGVRRDLTFFPELYAVRTAM